MPTAFIWVIMETLTHSAKLDKKITPPALKFVKTIGKGYKNRIYSNPMRGCSFQAGFFLWAAEREAGK